MKKLLLILIFLFSITNAVECFDGTQNVKIPSQILSQIGYKEYSITHSNYDCKWAYRRYKTLNVSAEQPINTQIAEIKTESEQTSKISILFPIALVVFILFVIWLIIKDDRIDDFVIPHNKPAEKYERPVENKNIAYENAITRAERNGRIDLVPKDVWKSSSVKEEPKQEVKGKFDDLADEYSRKLREIEKERQQSGFYTSVKPQAQREFKSDYDFLLHSPEWLDCRKSVFAAQGQYCAKCYSTKKLQVHHKFYLAYPNGKKVKPWEYPMGAFKVLCTDCHVKEHQTHKIKLYRISYNSNPKMFNCVQ